MEKEDLLDFLRRMQDHPRKIDFWYLCREVQDELYKRLDVDRDPKVSKKAWSISCEIRDMVARELARTILIRVRRDPGIISHTRLVDKQCEDFFSFYGRWLKRGKGKDEISVIIRQTLERLEKQPAA